MSVNCIFFMKRLSYVYNATYLLFKTNECAQSWIWLIRCLSWTATNNWSWLYSPIQNIWTSKTCKLALNLFIRFQLPHILNVRKIILPVFKWIQCIYESDKLKKLITASNILVTPLPYSCLKYMDYKTLSCLVNWFTMSSFCEFVLIFKLYIKYNWILLTV